ncbi:mandelate racemase/muconate lactonizing enzyme family protein (plasmid) [Herbiconiux sp. KACC 21604]|uniref:mandelate racemase/muconate lactonizing enzyme family protein n=1 Tax=unclassified Herbiconiux TaxID=2618217 RepID=UPI001492481E|nr:MULTISPECIES: mandelate racemase/muconate lactonizing enzyme family protein [unclassified Herbiconiux]QJU56318.1 mandelate racemase/muconate lactonizing enzyme family protein [Herbiconiux sp. SALV-R1]WPO88825.1 mandelate racemase/muconate lactonizing enzyme family protein [Herbiconiux sp. KACC 21604]
MKINGVDTVRVAAFPNLLYVRVHTDEGLVGLGETFYGSEAVERHVHSIAAPRLFGEDPARIEHISKSLEGYVGYAGSGVETRARSAIDLALWDLLGQATGQPVYNLLGGATREEIPIYNTCAGGLYVNSSSGQSVANWGVREGLYEDLHSAITRPAELARELLDQGITGMKIWPFDAVAEASRGTDFSRRQIADGLHRLASIREEVGMDMNVMVELHGLWDVPSASRLLRALEEFEPYWAEDPVRSDISRGLSRVAAATSIRIAAGETLGGLPAFDRLLEEEAAGVVTVDTTWCGGLTVARKVAALAEAKGIPVAPHDCTGPVALAACVHLSTAAPNVLVQETVRAAYAGWYGSLVEGGAEVTDGVVRAPSAPGLGIRLRDDVLSREGTTIVTSQVAASDLIDA